MPAKVHLRHDYPHPAQAVWNVATDMQAYAKVMDRLMTFEGLPDDPLHEGQQIDVTFRLFGKLPPQPYHMRLDVFSPEDRHFKSFEWGGAVKSWEHALRVVETEDGCVLTDDVTIDAGWLTPIYVAFARYMYRRRHPVRLQILNDKTMETA